VARKIESTRRRVLLSFQHHREVAKFDPDLQDSLLLPKLSKLPDVGTFFPSATMRWGLGKQLPRWRGNCSRSAPRPGDALAPAPSDSVMLLPLWQKPL
jgi:hypothetical protein